MGRSSKIRFGTGEGTTRRRLSPSGLNTQPRSAASLACSAWSYSGPTGLLGSANAGSAGSTSIIVSNEASGLSNGQPVPQFLLDQVADHPLGLGAQHIERGRGHLPVGRLLQRQQPDLRPVPVRDDQLVFTGDRGQVITRHPHVFPLVLRRHRLPPAQQRITA